MSSLTHIDKLKLESELGMATGYVLRFSNRTFDDFFREVVGVEIYGPNYDDSSSGSKANRMRTFWRVAADVQVIALLEGLMRGWDVYSDSPMPASAQNLFREILARLGSSKSVPQKAEPIDPPVEENTAKALIYQLIALSSLPPQKRGFEYERFLKGLFDAYGLSARASFRLVGEQIDGSFVMHNETYLFEAKWQNEPTGAEDLHTFEGKLGQKAFWTRGLFVSNSGFTPDGLQAFGRAKRLICMDGLDLAETLRLRLSLVAVLNQKLRLAAETGIPFTPIRDLLPQLL